MLPCCWAIPPEDGKTREQLLTVKTFPSEGGKQGGGGGGGGGEERREEEEGGREARGAQGCWWLERTGGGGGVGVSLFFSETDSSQSTPGGRASEQPAWGVTSFILFIFFNFFQFFFTLLHFLLVYVCLASGRAAALRCVQCTAWKPSPCSTCTEPSLSPLRCACSTSLLPSWKTW